jgi:hypothetical protein
VRAGETLSQIAAAHHMTWQAVYATPPNPRVLANPNVLVAGERLRIPAGPRLRAATQPATQPAPQPAAAQQQTAGQTLVTAGESAFERCVAWRESSDTPTDPDGLFGILPSVWQSLGYSGTAGQAPVTLQQQAFDRLYAEYGVQPWAPSDGC